jgi:hypothetical protein
LKGYVKYVFSSKDEKISLKEENYVILDALANSENGCEPKYILFYNYFKRKF